MRSPRTLARIAGALYLLLFGAAFNEGYVLPHVVRSGDAAATGGNIRAHATLFRLGVFGDLTAGGLWLLLAMTGQFVTVPAAAAGELTFLLWLLIKGVRTTSPSPPR
jgi:hypothetical protein